MNCFDENAILFLKDLQEFAFCKDEACFALIGNPVAKSISYMTHNQVFKLLNFHAHFFRIHLEEHELDIALKILHQRKFQGLAVTMPFKERVLPQMGAVNTLLFQQDGYRGENTDAMAIEKLLSPFFTPTTKVSLIGAGGCARAAVKVLTKHQIPFTVYNRTTNRPGLFALPLETFTSPPGEHIVINTTSIGMEPNIDQCPIDTKQLSSQTIVFDAIYRPFKTKLLLDAEAKGLHTISGVDMFIWQAIFQMRFFLPIPFEEKIVYDIMIACQKTRFSPCSALSQEEPFG